LSKNFDMKVVSNQIEIDNALAAIKNDKKNRVVGFVPTMGALHEGHMSLIEAARKTSDIVVCSIFVNPTQFNNSEDLATYPRTVEADKKLLISHGCDILLLPTVEAVYPNGTGNYSIDLDGLDQAMEGAFRPGHFIGVCMVVQRLFEMVSPTKAFFGQKDFQQLAIIRKMNDVKQLNVSIVSVPIKRNAFGLALSSRNSLLSDTERKSAEIIYKTLSSGVAFSKKNSKNTAITAHMKTVFLKGNLELEYITIVSNTSLKEVSSVDKNCTVCIAAYSGDVRLIDNMSFDRSSVD